MKDSLYQNLRERRCSGGNTALMNRYKRRLSKNILTFYNALLI